MVALSARIEPHFSPAVTTPSGAAIALEAPGDPSPSLDVSLVAPELRRDLRVITPFAFAGLAYELYMVGELTWEEYLLVGFPSDLHPRFNETIGALTGEIANPGRPKDMLADWEDRLDFLTRYQPLARRTHLSKRILDVLSRYHRDDLL